MKEEEKTKNMHERHNDDGDDAVTTREEDLRSLEPVGDPPPTWFEAYVGFVSLMLPTLIDMISQQFGTTTTRGVLFSVLFSSLPITIAINYDCTRLLIAIIFAVIGLPMIVIFLLLGPILSRAYIQNRQPAFDTAKEVLWNRIQNKRAQRCNGYDVFVPPPQSEKSRKSNNHLGLIYFPGALVEHTAYAPMAAKLSDHGILVVILSFEPLRTPSMYCGPANEEAIGRIIKEMIGLSIMKSIPGDNIDWSIGGHSMGSSAAYNIVSKQQSSPSLLKISNLLLVGGSSGGEKIGNLKDKHCNVNVLTIDASNDLLLQGFVSPTKRQEFYDTMLPPLEENEETGGRGKRRNFTRKVMISGGNHSGFGYYGPQTFPIQDGKRAISLEEQQNEMVLAIVNFLK